MKAKQYTNSDFWRRLSLSDKGRQNFPLVYYKTTGLEIEPGWKDPLGIISVNRTQLIWLKRFGFKSDEMLDYKWKNSELFIPLRHKYRNVGGFLMAYTGREGVRWVKYTYQPEVSPETPLIAFSGEQGKTSDCFITDSLGNYIKLINWYYCQHKYSSVKKKYLLVYVDQGKEGAIDLIKRHQLVFNKIYDFTDVGLLEQVKKQYIRLDSNWDNHYTKEFIYFNINPLSNVTSKKLLETSISFLSQKL